MPTRDPICKYCAGPHTSGAHRYHAPNYEPPLTIFSHREFTPKNESVKAKAALEAARAIAHTPADEPQIRRALMHFYGVEPAPLEPPF